MCAPALRALAFTLSPLACSTSEGGQRTGLAGFLRLARGGGAGAVAGSGSGCVKNGAEEDAYYALAKITASYPPGVVVHPTGVANAMDVQKTWHTVARPKYTKTNQQI